jgi:hypothetical protein
MNRFRFGFHFLPIIFSILAVLPSCSNSSAKAITSFSILGLEKPAAIDEAAKEITVWIRPDASGNFLDKSGNHLDMSSLTARFVCTGKEITVGGTPQLSKQTRNNFNYPVTYTVTAKDGSTAVYTVRLESMRRKELTSLWFDPPLAPAHIYQEEGIIEVAIPAETDASSLAASFKVIGKEVSVDGVPQESGKTRNDFKKPLKYTLTAMDGSSRDYAVVVLDRNWRLVEPIVPGTEEKKPDPRFAPSGPEKDILALEVSPGGIPYVVLSDEKEIASIRSIEVLRLADVAWSRVGEKSIEGRDIRRNITIGFGPEDRPYIAYTDWTGGNERPNLFVRVHELHEGSWRVIPGADFAADEFSFAVDRDGTPHLAYWWFDVFGKGIALTTVKYSGGAWEEFGDREFGSNDVDAMMAFDPAGTLWLVRRCLSGEGINRNTSEAEIRIERLVNGKWESAGEPIPPRNTGNLTMDFGVDGTPYIAFSEGSPDWESGVRVLQLVEGAWRETGRVATEKKEIWPLFLRMDREGRPLLAFMERQAFMVENAEFGHATEYSYRSRVLRLDGGSFRPLGSERFVEGLIVNDMTIDRSGMPLIYDMGSKIYRYE